MDFKTIYTTFTTELNTWWPTAGNTPIFWENATITPPSSAYIAPIPVPLLEDQDMPYLLRAKASPTDGLWLIDGDKAVNIATEASFEYARKQSPTVPVVTLDAPTARLFLTTKTAVMDRR